MAKVTAKRKWHECVIKYVSIVAKVGKQLRWLSSLATFSFFTLLFVIL